jgi:serine/threonine-protein kinase RsbW
MIERRFPRTIAALEHVFAFLAEYMTSHRVDAASMYAVNLAVEEFFTNMVKYDVGGTDGIKLSLDLGEDSVRVKLEDENVEPFDVTKAPHVDTLKSLDGRKVGGLGIHLSRHLLDGIDYEYINRCSIITITKHRER